LAKALFVQTAGIICLISSNSAAKCSAGAGVDLRRGFRKEFFVHPSKANLREKTMYLSSIH